jgi:hypothetical protein
VCVAFRSVEVFPSPKSQAHAVTLPVEASVKATADPVGMTVAFALKLATGGSSTEIAVAALML